MSSSVRFAFAAALALSFGSAAAAGDARPRRPAAVVKQPPSNRVAFMGYLRDKRVVTVYTDGRATIAQPRPATAPMSPRDRGAALLRAARAHGPAVMQRRLPATRYGSLDGEVAPRVRAQILADLERDPAPYAAGRVVVVFKPGVTIAQDRAELTPAAAVTLRSAILAKRRDITPHPFTNDARTNAALMQLGVDRSERLFSTYDRGTLGALRARGEARAHRALLAFDNAFVLHAGASSVENTVRALRANPSVAYAAPDFAVSSMLAERRPVPQEAVREIAAYHRAPRTFGRATRSTAPSAVPRNAAVSFNLQALLNAPGVDAVAAFDEIGQRFGQLPGTGEIVTNVGIGDVVDASEATDPNDPCRAYASGGLVTTHRIGGQRYLDLPSLPLIPVWVADESGNLSTTSGVCGVDPALAEVGLDFSMMAPLPDEAQRAGETAPFGADLLGIAPGASYRWIAPGTTNGALAESNVLGALIGAARQQPAPSVITASIGFGADGYGFPGRYLEDDPLASSIVTAIVSTNIVVCIAANDGTRSFTTAAIGPSGGSAPTIAGTDATTLSDLYYTTAPSVVPDSGAIDVGATTLDDIFSANPHDPASANLANVEAFAETRFNGMLGFSSGFGSRVNVAAPGDNVLGLFLAGNTYDAVALENAGGTSASAPEVAAAAAIAIQVAKLTGHPFTSATQVRDALVATGTPVANPPQTDVVANVGPQVSVRRVVEQLLANAAKPVAPGIARVAVHGRRGGSYLASGNTRDTNDAAYVTALDPAFIKLDGPFTIPENSRGVAFPGSDTGADLNSYITIAPDWEGIPANATYRLTVAGRPAQVVARTPYARLLPAQLFAAAGLTMTPGTSHTLSLTYSATTGLHTIAESTFQLTFGPPAPASRLVLAPHVPAVVTGATIPVTYDLRGYPAGQLSSPTVDVSCPGTANTKQSVLGLVPCYTAALASTHGTVNVPVSALAGAGTYSVWIDLQPGSTAFVSDISDLAFTRVDAGTARPPAPLLSLTRGGPASHHLDVPYKGTFAVSYDVSRVPGATGAIVELAAPPPSPFFYVFGNDALNTIRNPNGNTIDDNGVVTGSLYHVQSAGAVGTVTIDPVAAAVPATNTVNVRVIPTAGNTPVAEASDSSFIGYHGIDTSFGLPIESNYMNPIGTDGYLVEYGGFGTSQANIAIAAVEPYDLTNGTVTGIPLSFTSNNFVTFPVVQNDTVVAGNTNDYTTFDYFRGSPPAAGFASFAFPAGSIPSTALVLAAGPKSSSTRSAYLALDLATGSAIVSRGDVTTGTGFAPGIDVTSLLGSNPDFQAFIMMAYDANADRAYMLVEDASTPCEQQSPQLVTVDFSTGTATVKDLGIGGGVPGGGSDGYHLALDPMTHVAAIATSCQAQGRGSGFAFRAELTLVDLTTGASKRVYHHELTQAQQDVRGFPALIGGDSAMIGIDDVNHLVLQRSMFCPQLLSDADMNARPCLNEYDERGTLVKTVRGLFGDGSWGQTPEFNGVNGTTRTGVVDGQLAYTLFILSFDVQPFSY